MSKKKINLAIIFPTIEDWQGGLNYFITLVSALNLIKKKDFDFKVFSSIENKDIIENIVPKKCIIYANCLKKFTFSYFFRKFIEYILRNDFFLEKILKKNNINITSHHKPFKNIKSICWIPDLQHKIIKKNFSIKEINQRDKIFKNYIINSSKLLVSSKTSKKHLIKSYKYIDNGKIEILNFVPFLDITKIKKFSSIKKKFKLPENYFFCPNQFWTHKNHILIIEALNLIKNKKINFKIIFSGSKNDYRNSKHILLIKKKIKDYNLSQFFIFLDKIKYDEVISLIYYSNAIINPSTFEGWSSTVEEAKLLNKRIFLSKIETHVEQNPKNASYFAINNFKKLSNLLLSFSINKKIYSLKIIKNKTNYLRKKFANNYYKILKNTL